MKHLYLSIFFTLIIILAGCKKYPEDHKISLQTAKKRLRQHAWHLSKLYINGADSTMAHLHNIIPGSNKTRDFSFMVTKGLNYKTDGGEISFPFFPKPNSAYPDYTSIISINKHKTILSIGGGTIDNYHNGPIVSSNSNSIMWVIGSSQVDWEITKLTKTDLHLKTTNNNYEVKFEFVD
jgi:hypothetical protein